MIVDVQFEENVDDSLGVWASDVASAPLLDVAIYSDRPISRLGVRREHTVVGQWITLEKDRAVFVIPKTEYMFTNLWIVPKVAVRGGPRRPRVWGKWVPKETPNGWQFRLEVNRDGTVKKTPWETAEPSGAELG